MAKAKPRAGTRKRGYSREFRARAGTGKNYFLEAVPAGLWTRVRAKCEAEGVSIRAQILRLLTGWIGEG